MADGVIIDAELPGDVEGDVGGEDGAGYFQLSAGSRDEAGAAYYKVVRAEYGGEGFVRVTGDVAWD